MSGPGRESTPDKKACSRLSRIVDSFKTFLLAGRNGPRARSSAAEQVAHNHLVVGSNPTGPTCFLCGVV